MELKKTQFLNINTNSHTIESSPEFELRAVTDNSHDIYTVQQAINSFGFGWFHVKLSLLVGLCWMADSMEMTILSIIGPAMFCEWNITKYQQAFVTTIVFLGMMISSTFWTQLSNRYGRKSALTLCGVLLVLYSILSSVAPSYPWLLLLRGLVGFAIGCVPQSLKILFRAFFEPLYILSSFIGLIIFGPEVKGVTLYAEFLPTKHKGKCVILMDCFWALGACFEVVLALTIYPILGWRGLLGFSAAPLFIFTILSPWLKESARFYASNGQSDKAIRILEQIANNNNRHMLIGRLVADDENGATESFYSLLTSELWPTTLLLWFIWLTSAFCYYGLILTTTELMVSRNKENNPNECITFLTADFMDLLWITLSEFPGILITIEILTILGKKKTMIVQFSVHIICTIILINSTSRFLTLISLFVARSALSGLFQAIYVYTPEVYPNSLRSLGVGGCSVFARIGAMLTPFVAQVILQTSHWQAISIYGIIGFLAACACSLLP